MYLNGMKWVKKLNYLRKKDPSIQLEARKSSIKDLFNDLLDETKGLSIK